MANVQDLSVLALADQVRRRALSPVEVARATLARIGALEGQLLAWQLVDEQGLLAQAEAVERRVARGDEVGRLAGVPLGVKDIYDVAGLPTTAGARVYGAPVAREDCWAVAGLRSAGALIVGKTVTTPFAHLDPAATRNPWHPQHTPGGSSSGSAAAVAARMVPAALGTQTAGSVLRPAAFCGVVGLKPSFGRISRQGIVPVAWSLDTPGVIARSVDDAVAILQAMATPDPVDPSMRGEAPLELGHAVGNATPPRLGVVAELLQAAEPELARHLRAVAERLARAGAPLAEVALPYPNDLMLAAHRVILGVEAASSHHALLSARAPEYPPRLRAFLEVGQVVPGTAYLQAQRLARRFAKALAPLFADCDALLLPVAPGPAPDTSSTGSPAMLAPWTMLGVPAISLPSGLSADGLPLAVQLISARAADARLVAAARWCEAVLGPLPSPGLPRA